MILYHGICPSGETIFRLFASHQTLKKFQTEYHTTPIKRRRINLSKTEKVERLFLNICTQLNNNLSLNSSLAESLHYLSKNSLNPLLNAIFHALYQSLQAGKDFYTALSTLGICFPTQQIQLIKQAEKNNRLTESLKATIDHLSQRAEQKSEVKKKLTYPCILLISVFLFLHFIVLTLFPNMLSLFLSLGKKPSAWLQHTEHYKSLLFIADGGILFALLISGSPIFPSLKKKIKNHIQSIPFIRSIPLQASRLYWLRTFVLQFSSGTPLPLSFQVATAACSTSPLKKSLLNIHKKIQDGTSPSQAMSNQPLLPADWVLTFKLGERNNNLVPLCHQLINKENLALLSKLNNLVALIEPVTLLVLGSLVLFLVITLYGPLLNSFSSSMTVG